MDVAFSSASKDAVADEIAFMYIYTSNNICVSLKEKGFVVYDDRSIYIYIFVYYAFTSALGTTVDCCSSLTVRYAALFQHAL